MKKLQDIKKLLDAAKIATLPDRYFKTISGKSSIDKHALKFGGGDRFSVFRTTVLLTCYTGYYGSSSCSTFSHMDNDLAREALDHYLNKNMKAVLAGMGEYLEAKARTLVEEAEKELAQEQAILDSLKTQD